MVINSFHKNLRAFFRFFDVSSGFQDLARRASDQVDHGHEGLGIAVSPGSCACSLK